MNWIDRAANAIVAAISHKQKHSPPMLKDEVSDLNRDLAALNKTIDWSAYPSPERQVKQTQFEMQYTQIYLNKRQIGLTVWMKWATITVALMSIAQVVVAIINSCSR